MTENLQPTLVSAPASTNTKDLIRFEAEKKSAGTALILCWILGAFGAHRFYMERTGSGAAMLIITLISIPLTFIIIGGVGLFAISIWVLIDLFSVTRWAREYNAGLLAKIQSGQG